MQGATAIGSVILYFTKFRATDSLLARRVDMLGLNERIVTMMELEKEDSYIAQRQREDANEKLKTVSPKQLKFRMARKSIACIATAAVLAPAMMVVCELAALGILNSGLEIINPNANAVPEIMVTYEADEGGSISGDEDQIIYVGESTAPVLAVADEGWVFVGWSDGYYDPFRFDTGLTEDTIFTAIFEKIEDDGAAEGGQGEGYGNGPGMPGEGQGNGQGQGQGQGQGEGLGESSGEGQGDGAGLSHSASNKVIDGMKDYGDVFDLEGAMDSISDGNSSGTIGDVIGNYFGNL